MSAQPGSFRAGGKNGNRYPVRDAAEIERVRLVYAANEVPLYEIERRFKMTTSELRNLVTAKGWLPRKHMRKQQPAVRLKPKVRPRTEAQARLARRIEEHARESYLYGFFAADAKVLRGRGFVVDRIGLDPKSDLVRCGDKIITFAELKAKAGRERRLARVAA